jgi:Asp-tRNA(Asn)/Glu-tRNA(Gln) amidotransferase A subunit family amidase
MMDCTHGPAPGDPYAAPPPARSFAEEAGAEPGRLRIALMTDGFDGRPLDPECIKGAEDTAKLCADLGHHVEPAQPKLDVGALLQASRTVIAGNVWTTVRLRCQALGREPDGQDVEPITWAFAQEGVSATAGDYAAAIMVMHQQGRKLAAFFQDYDLILSSTMRHPPLPLGAIDMQDSDLDHYYKVLFEDELAITLFYNNTGCPAMSVPLHWSDEGLPVGIHFGAAFGDEATLFRLASQLETARPWFEKVPDLN